LTAKYAPDAPMRHAMALGVVGLIVGAAGAIATIPTHLGPAWYPIALVLTALPCAWLGGPLSRVRQADRRATEDPGEKTRPKSTPPTGRPTASASVRRRPSSHRPESMRG